MTDDAQTDDGCTVFEFDQTEDEEPDIYADEFFTNRYGDRRACLDGDTYEAKDIIKFDWEVTHHDFDDRTNRWVVDVDALDELEERLTDAGFTVDFDPTSEQGGDDPLFDLHEYVQEDDEISVVYTQKNGEGENTKEGRVVGVSFNSGKDHLPEISFRRLDDDHYMYVRFDDYGKVALYTAGSHAPFVGAVERVVVDSDEDRGVFEDDDTESLTDMKRRVENDA